MNEFEPPDTDDAPAAWSWATALLAWGMAGATAGTAVGATLQLVFGIPNAGAFWGLGGAALVAMAGGVALGVERNHAGHRPELTDVRGHRSRPLHGLMLGIPVLVALPSLLWLVIVVTIGLRSWVPALTFGMGAFAVAWAGQRVWSNHQLARTLEALELGRTLEAKAALERLATRGFVSRSVRTAARLNLAMLALNDGDGDAAVDWADARPGTGAFAWAAVARSLGHLLRGDPVDEAEEWLTKAVTGPGARAVQPEADAIRVLLVWRRDGEAAARAIGEELHAPGATTLHRALLSVLRERAGDEAGARSLRTDEVEGLVYGALGRAIPELR
ncbi:MAG: hypothetical protein H6735_26930 [Alphaproteobacteria bacterium]|nr:hypothetical protein [Alphaproteobacteria bacterium]